MIEVTYKDRTRYHVHPESLRRGSSQPSTFNDTPESLKWVDME